VRAYRRRDGERGAHEDNQEDSRHDALLLA
jgi:hypothetical protein